MSVLERLKKIYLLVLCRLPTDAIPKVAFRIGDYSMGHLPPRKNVPCVLVRIVG
jgi:hypothetical protein